MKTYVIVALVLLTVATGCSTLSVLESERDYAKNGFGADLKGGIDRAIRDEIERKSPNGAGADAADPWQTYWKWRIRTFRERPMSEVSGYRGPDGKWFIEYIIVERRKVGLPEIMQEPNLK